MEICKKCGGIAEWNSYYGGVTCTRCGYVEKKSPINLNVVKTMSAEEIVRLFNPSNCPPDYNPGFCYPDDADCGLCWIGWLEEQAQSLSERMV